MEYINAEENRESLDKKPVSTAIDEVYSGKLTLTREAAPETLD